MQIEDVYNEFGNMGLFHWTLVATLCLLRSNVNLQRLNYVFVARPIPFKCITDKHTTISKPANDTEQCQEECSAYQFDTTNESTILSEWSLVCEERWFGPFTLTLAYLGVIVGSLLLGPVADWRGRKPVIFISILGLAASSLVGGLVDSYNVYCVTRFTTGMFLYFNETVNLYLSEIVGSKKRPLMAACFSLGGTVGGLMLSLIAYFLPHWRHLHFGVTVYTTICLFFYVIVPETPGWLLVNGHVEEAENVVRALAMGSGYQFTDDFHLQPPDNRLKKETFVNFIKHWKLFVLFVMLTVTFATMRILNDSAYLLAGAISGDLYLGTAISCLVEVPGDFLGAAIMTYAGRKTTVSLFLISGGLSLLFVLLLPSTAFPVLILYGKIVFNSSSGLYSIHRNELIPTTIRARTVGVTMVFASGFSSLTPFIVALGDVYPNLHFIVLGGLSISVGILYSLLVPETAGRDLPDTIKDAKNLFESEVVEEEKSLLK